MSSGSSTMPIRSRSTQNASILPTSSRQKSSRSAGPGAGRRSRRGRRGRAPLVGRDGFVAPPGRPEVAREPNHLGTDRGVFAVGRLEDPLGVSVSERIVCRILRANRLRAQTAVALACREDDVGQVAFEAIERGLGRGRPLVGRPQRGHGIVLRGGCRPAPSASSIRSTTPGSCSSAVSVWNRPTGRPGRRRRASRAPPRSRLHRLEPLTPRSRVDRPAARTHGRVAGRGHRRAGTPTSAGPTHRPAARSREPHRVELLEHEVAIDLLVAGEIGRPQAPNTPPHSSMKASRADGRRLSGRASARRIGGRRSTSRRPARARRTRRGTPGRCRGTRASPKSRGDAHR